ncbi:extracellular solute-binding protein [Cytobacillus oceanisediminis]|uniref:extracellular solute-binding protein n=1 Tax=Cytobacillus oceanisediminis TaxID=665099 RepID=UPI0011A781E0|nr:extracellular solute-binding protein [Cytobacillus oceanisediminis]MBZ9535813.1 extracellular solute-binding protein [Cytobacillus oceanisediminis]
MKGKKIRFLLSLLLISSIYLSGCSPFNESSKVNNNNEEIVNLEITRSGNNLPAPEKDIVKQKLDEVLGTNITLSVTANEYKNQLNVRMAAGDYPDLFEVDRESLIQFAQKDLLLDLTKYSDELKGVSDFIGDENIKKATIDGKMYGVAVPAGVPYETYWIRKDWLEALGMDIPETLEELYEVSKAFTEQDPDGNGKKDTYGITGSGLNAFQPVFGAFEVGIPGSFYLKDGDLVNSYKDPDMKDALEYIQKLIDAGVVDPELVTNTGLQHQEKAFQGHYGIIFLDWPNIVKDVVVEQYKTVNPSAEWIQIAGPQGPRGQFDGTWDIGQTRGYFAIPKALEKEPEKLQKIFDLLNYVSDKDGSMLVQYGLEGKHYNIEEGEVVPTELLAKDGHYFWMYQFTGRPEMDYLMTKFKTLTEHIKFSAERPRIEALNGFIDTPKGYNSADANRFAEEEMIKFVYGKRPLSEYGDFLQILESNFNYQMMLDKAQEQLEELGIVK